MYEMSVAQQAIKFDIHSIAKLIFILKFNPNEYVWLGAAFRFILMAKQTYKIKETNNSHRNRNLATKRLDVCQFDMVWADLF